MDTTTTTPERLSDEAVNPADAEQILARLKAERDAVAGRLPVIASGPLARFAFEHLVLHGAGTVRNAEEMLAHREREQEDLARTVRRYDAAITECERRAALWTDAHAARMAHRHTYATASARVERSQHAITKSGRPGSEISQGELDAFVVAVRDLHAAARALLPMVDVGDEKDTLRNTLNTSAREILQVRSAPKSLLDRVQSVPAPVAAVETHR